MINYGLKINNEMAKLDEIEYNLIIIKSGEVKVIKECYNSGVIHNKYILEKNAKLIINCRMNVEGEICDLYHDVEMRGSNSEVKILLKGVVAQNSKIIYRSKIYTEHNLKNLNINQSAKFLKVKTNNALNTSQNPDSEVAIIKSEIDAIPMLEINTKDVSASHSLAISDINIYDIYYLQLYGLDESEANSALLNSIFLYQNLL
jgi:Fe-S cluster assembly scaffold protein SufB